MKLNDLIVAKPALEKIAKEEYDIVDAKIIAEFTRKALEAIGKFETKRADLFKKYGESQEDGNIKIKEKHVEKFQEAIEKELNKNIRIAALDTKSLNIKISPADMVNCLPLFK